MPLTSIIAEAQLYPGPDVRVFSAYLDNSGKYINVGYYLNSDFYSDDSTGTYFSIGYKFANEQLNRIYQNQFVHINGQKGYHWVSLPYTVGGASKVIISTSYQTNALSAPYGSGSFHNDQEKGSFFIAPAGEQVTYHEVTMGDVNFQSFTTKTKDFVMEYSSDIWLKVLSGYLAKIASYGVADPAFGFDPAPPTLIKGQFVKTTIWYDNYKVYANIKVWHNRDSYNKNAEPIYDNDGSININ
jgi:hypothetical protein